MSAEFPTDAERDAAMTSRGMHFGLITTAEEILSALAPLIRAREAAAWDAGADAAWQRSTPEVNGLHYHWRTSGEPLNPYRQEADNDRD